MTEVESRWGSAPHPGVYLPCKWTRPVVYGGRSRATLESDLTALQVSPPGDSVSRLGGFAFVYEAPLPAPCKASKLPPEATA